MWKKPLGASFSLGGLGAGRGFGAAQRRGIEGFRRVGSASVCEARGFDTDWHDHAGRCGIVWGLGLERRLDSARFTQWRGAGSVAGGRFCGLELRVFVASALHRFANLEDSIRTGMIMPVRVESSGVFGGGSARQRGRVRGRGATQLAEELHPIQSLGR